ncbi:MAG: rRNA adenine N-6-methyltransferase family protein [Solirubrobacteraceae bacterium]
MNRAHNALCASGWWSTRVERELLPWGLDGVQLGDDLLEIGPGFGASTSVLARRPGKLNVIELDERYCRRLSAELGERVIVSQGDATERPG